MSVKQTDSTQMRPAAEEGNDFPLPKEVQEDIAEAIEQGLSEVKRGEIQDSEISKKLAIRVARSITHYYSGPLPPPGMLKEYNEIQSDFAERIMRLTEEEARHRREMEKAVVRGGHNRMSRAQ